jgi:hypothetical protein
MTTIFTLNTRSHVMLEVIRDEFELKPEQMRREIAALHTELLSVFRSKGIVYTDLRSALTPSTDRYEAAFLFDAHAFDSGLYGRETFNWILPLLDPRSTQSILHGDLDGNDQRLIFEILRESVAWSRSFTFRHSTQIYCVYINSLTMPQLERLRVGLVACPAYLGFIDTTFSCRAKVLLSTTLSSFIVKKGQSLIVGHEDDRSNDENVNITFYPLQDFGHRLFSLQAQYFSIFLAYKIERPAFNHLEADTELSLNAISDEVILFDGFDVVLDEAKYQYLLNAKSGKLRQAGLTDVGREQLAELIRAKLTANYIYNLTYLEEHDVMKFNLLIEVPRRSGYPARLTAALEYIPGSKSLRVITLC